MQTTDSKISNTNLKSEESTSNVSAEVVNNDNEVLLCIACSTGHYKLVELLVNKGADLNFKGKCGEHTPLMEAVNCGSLAIVKLLLDNGADVNLKSKTGSTALHIACESGKLNLVTTLVEYEADTLALNCQFRTPVMEAAFHGFLDIVAYLLDYNPVTINPADSFVELPPHVLKIRPKGFNNVKDFEQLLEDINNNMEGGCRTDCQHEDYCYKSSLVQNRISSLSSDSVQSIDSKICPTYSLKETPLLIAASRGHSNVVKEILLRSENMLQEDQDIVSAIIEATIDGRTEVVKIIFEHCIGKFNLSDVLSSPLFLAINGGYLDLVKLIINYGADILELSHEDNSVLMEAAREGHLDIIQFFVEKGVDINYISKEKGDTALTLACSSGNIDAVQYLVEKGASINLGYKSPLMIACLYQYYDIVIFLLKKGCLINLKCPQEATALYYACENGNFDIIKMLLDNHATVDSINENCKTPLVKAVEGEYLDVVELLISRGADVNYYNSDNECSPLIAAVKIGNVVLCKLLIMYGADPSVKLKNDSNLLCEAARKGFKDCVELFLMPSSQAKNQGIYSNNEEDNEEDNQVEMEATEIPSIGKNNFDKLDCTLEGFDFNTQTLENLCKIDWEELTNELFSNNQNGYFGDLLKMGAFKDDQVLSDSQNKYNKGASVLSIIDSLSIDAKEGNGQNDNAPNSKIKKLMKNYNLVSENPETSVIKEVSSNMQLKASKSNGNSTESGLEIEETLKVDYRQFKNQRVLNDLLFQHNTCSVPNKPSLPYNKFCLQQNFSTIEILTRMERHFSTINKPLINVNDKNSTNKETALIIAASCDQCEISKFLLENGAEVNVYDKRGYTPLISAAASGSFKICEELVKRKADVNFKTTHSSETALILACDFGSLEIVDLLVSNGAHLEIKNVNNHTPLSIASGHGYTDIVKFLLNKKADINNKPGYSPLMIAAMNGHFECVKLLIESGADINYSSDNTGRTALSLAVSHDHRKIVSFLASKCPILVDAKTKNGITCFQEAAINNNIEIAKILINNKADINAISNTAVKDNALTLASEKGNFEFIELLLKQKMHPDFRNKKGQTASWLCSSGGYLKCLILLYDYKADIELCDYQNISPLLIAYKNCHYNVVEWLVNKVNQLPSLSQCSKYTPKNSIEIYKKMYDLLKKTTQERTEIAELNANQLILENEKKNKKKKRRKPKKTKFLNPNENIILSIDTTVEKSTIENNSDDNNHMEQIGNNNSKEKNVPSILKSEEVKLDMFEDSNHTSPNVNFRQPFSQEDENINKPLFSNSNSDDNRNINQSDSEEWQTTDRRRRVVQKSNYVKNVNHVIYVLRSSVSKIIGRNGLTISSIKQKTNTFIDIDTRTDTQSEHCSATVVGQPENVDEAVRLIKNLEKPTGTALEELSPYMRDINIRGSANAVEVNSSNAPSPSPSPTINTYRSNQKPMYNSNITTGNQKSVKIRTANTPTTQREKTLLPVSRPASAVGTPSKNITSIITTGTTSINYITPQMNLSSQKEEQVKNLVKKTASLSLSEKQQEDDEPEKFTLPLFRKETFDIKQFWAGFFDKNNVMPKKPNLNESKNELCPFNGRTQLPSRFSDDFPPNVKASKFFQEVYSTKPKTERRTEPGNKTTPIRSDKSDSLQNFIDHIENGVNKHNPVDVATNYEQTRRNTMEVNRGVPVKTYVSNMQMNSVEPQAYSPMNHNYGYRYVQSGGYLDPNQMNERMYYMRKMNSGSQYPNRHQQQQSPQMMRSSPGMEYTIMNEPPCFHEVLNLLNRLGLTDLYYNLYNGSITVYNLYYMTDDMFIEYGLNRFAVANFRNMLRDIIQKYF